LLSIKGVKMNLLKHLKHLNYLIIYIYIFFMSYEESHNLSPVELGNIENTPLGIVEWTKDFQICLWKGRMQEIFGWTSEEVINQDPFDLNLVHNDDINYVVSKLELMKSGKVLNDITINRNYTKDGKIKYLEWYNSVILDKDGNVSSILSLVHDITDREFSEKRLQREKIFSETIIKSLPGIFYLFDENGTFISWNKNFEHKTGYSEEELERMHPLDFFHEKDKHWIASTIHEVYETEIATIEANLKTKSGELIPHFFTVNLMYDGEKKYTIGMAFDISIRKEQEALLKKLNTDLKLRAKDLADSNKELEQFAYIASHDLQEPLRMVTGFLQILQKKYGPQLDEAANQYINFAVDGADRMKGLIKDLLEFSRVGRENEETSEVDLENVINETILLLKPIIDDAKANIHIDELPKVRGNERMLKQIFQNLISNAIKYRKKDEPLDIKIFSNENEESWVFAVEDNGIGIEEKNFQRIFVVFQRLHGRSEYSGTGIGLAICKKIVEKMNGKIWVDSEVGKGSIFYISLPKEPQSFM
jgi:PAS domain S-box-containing protein